MGVFTEEETEGGGEGGEEVGGREGVGCVCRAGGLFSLLGGGGRGVGDEIIMTPSCKECPLLTGCQQRNIYPQLELYYCPNHF